MQFRIKIWTSPDENNNNEFYPCRWLLKDKDFKSKNKIAQKTCAGEANQSQVEMGQHWRHDSSYVY